MILTIIFIIYTVIKTRQEPACKAYIRRISKKYINHCSVLFTPMIYRDPRIPNWIENDLISPVSDNKHDAELHMAVTFDSIIGMYGIYPRQEISISNWLSYKDKISLFPLKKGQNCRISSKADERLYVVIDTAIDSYHENPPKYCIKIEDYGQIKAWIAKTDSNTLHLLLETDIDHFAALGTVFIQGHHQINNALFMNRVQSVAITGEPCIYQGYNEESQYPPSWHRNALNAFSNAAVNAVSWNKPVEVTDYSGVFVYPQKGSAVLKAKKLNFEDLKTLKKVDQMLSFPITPVNTTQQITNKLQEEETFEIYEKREDIISKPPNVLIYADTADTAENIKSLLTKMLDPERYTIYYLTPLDAPKNNWVNQVALVVVCGNILNNAADRILEYIIHGGKVLALCSNMLYILLPSFKTAEMRENELVCLSYGKWKRVHMMHDITCYQASPRRNHFQDFDDKRRFSSKVPQSADYEDKQGKSHVFDVKILGEEETWQNPSILLATLANSDGKIVFSQVHLEKDPKEYENEEDLFETLEKSNAARLEIITDLLSTHLGMEINHAIKTPIAYTPAYLLSKTENFKIELLKNLSNLTEDYILQQSSLKMQFFTSIEEISKIASEDFLPIIMNDKARPLNFSPTQYYQTLQTKKLGQLIIYSDILTTTMNVIEGIATHGLAVITRQQTQGRGRCFNKWISPVGSVLFTVQIHVPINSILGRQISILQHIVAVAMISAIRSTPGYKNINLRIKWPNDIYVGTSIKIGGLIVRTHINSSNYICNIGAGLNLSNSKPTICINDVISQYNEKYKANLEKFSYERYMALVFNQLEYLLDCVERNNIKHFHSLYYQYWLHKNATVTVIQPNGEPMEATILSIDDFGHLKVRSSLYDRDITVHPDSNSFDLLKGLIIPL